jgi:hypothetical protein
MDDAADASEDPAAELLDELREILRTFGVSETEFDAMPPAARMFLAGQYQEVRRCAVAIEKLQKRIGVLEKELCGPEHEPDTKRYTRTHTAEIDPSSETRGNPVIAMPALSRQQR